MPSFLLDRTSQIGPVSDKEFADAIGSLRKTGEFLRVIAYLSQKAHTYAEQHTMSFATEHQDKAAAIRYLGIRDIIAIFLGGEEVHEAMLMDTEDQPEAVYAPSGFMLRDPDLDDD